MKFTGFVSGEGAPPERLGHFTAALEEPGRVTLWRDPSGGERLYFREENGRLLYSSSLKDLLRSPKLDFEMAFERGLAELAHFGDGTAVAGVREVLPGHRLTADASGIRQEWAWGDILEPLHGQPAALARELRRRLKDAVARCVGPEAAVALSGGADSAGVAALACELVGPDKVHAFTFEYQDPGHPSEVEAARAVCKHLGIGRHTVVPITFDDFADAAPLAVWLAEDPGYWKRSYPVALSRAVKAAGFDRFVTGFGIGSHMADLGHRAEAAERFPGALRAWTLQSDLLGWLHPGLKPPVFRQYYPLIAVLRKRGLIDDARPYFPGPLGGRVEEALRSPRVRVPADEPLATVLRRQAFLSMNSCADVVRCERVARETGAGWLGPAHFSSCIPYCYLPAPGGDALRPGKFLLRLALADALPPFVLRQKKNWTQTIGSRAWRNRVLERMDAAAGPSWEALREVFGADLEAAKAYAPEGMIPLAFWHRVLLSGFSRAPTWEELGVVESPR